MGKIMSTEDCAKVLKAMGDRSRLEILRLLFEGEKCVSEIVDILAMDQPHISHHLNILRTAGLVYSRRESSRIVNCLHPAMRDKLSGKKMVDLGCCSIEFKNARI